MTKIKRTQYFIRSLVLLCLFGFAPLASAADNVRPFIVGGLAFGGENLAW